MELDLQSFLGSCVQLYLLAEVPQLPAFGLIYEGAIGQPRQTTSLYDTPPPPLLYLWPVRAGVPGPPVWENGEENQTITKHWITKRCQSHTGFNVTVTIARCHKVNNKEKSKLSLLIVFLLHTVYTVKKVIVFPVPSRGFTNKTPLGRELLNYSQPGRVWLMTFRLGTGKPVTFFTEYVLNFVASLCSVGPSKQWQLFKMFFSSRKIQTCHVSRLPFLFKTLLYTKNLLKAWTLFGIEESSKSATRSLETDKNRKDNSKNICLMFYLFLSYGVRSSWLHM